jgi:hypothetical protein
VLALQGALSVPDICGALAAPDGEARSSRHMAWFDDNVGGQYRTGSEEPDLDGSARYSSRTSPRCRARCTRAPASAGPPCVARRRA